MGFPSLSCGALSRPQIWQLVWFWVVCEWDKDDKFLKLNSYELRIQICPGWFCFQIGSLPIWVVVPTAAQTKCSWLMVRWGASAPDPVQILTETCYLTVISLMQSCKLFQLRKSYGICLNAARFLITAFLAQKWELRALINQVKRWSGFPVAACKFFGALRCYQGMNTPVQGLKTVLK